MRLSRVVSVLALVVAVWGCDRRVEPYVPPEQELPPPERPVRIPGLERPASRVEDLSAPAREPRALDAAAGPELAGAEIRGRVRLAQSVAQPSAGVLFVIARVSGGGPPLAVKRLPPGPFPIEFALGPGDVMIQGRPFAGPLHLTARFDRDGDPLTRGPDDLAGAVAEPLEPGASGVEIVLERQT